MTLTALPSGTVEVTDPTHPLYGLTLPLLGVANKQYVGRACAVWLAPGVERLIPVAATDLGGPRPPPSPCRLSVMAIKQLLVAVASLPEYAWEDTRGRGEQPGGGSEHSSARPAAHQRAHTGGRRGPGRAPGGGVGDPVAGSTPAADADRPAGLRGGGA
jgi:hypothetical protein